MTAGVYVLRDPFDNEVKYVGRSVNIERRLRQHASSPSLYRWKKRLKDLGSAPIVEIYESFDVNEQTTVEAMLISSMKPILNKALAYPVKGVDVSESAVHAAMKKKRAESSGKCPCCGQLLPKKDVLK